MIRGPLPSLASALLFFGCGVEDAFYTAPPPPGAARSVVYAIESDDEVKLEARAIDKGSTPPVTIDFDRLGRSHIWVLYYDRPLADHGLKEGTVEPLAEGSPLDRPDRIHRAEFLGGELGEWTEEPELSPRMQSLAVDRTPPRDPCPRFGEERVFELTGRSDGAFALRLDGDRALVGTIDARLYVVTVDGVDPLGKAIPFRMESGELAPDGSLFVAGSGGRTFRGSIEPALALTEHARGESRDAFRWIDGAKDGASEELFAVTSSGALERFDGSRWTMLLPPTGEDWRRGVAWIAPGEGVAVGLSAPIVRAIGNAVDAEPVDTFDPLTSVAHVPGVGTIAGTLTGNLVMHRDDRWELLSDPPFDLPATAIAPIGGGFVVSGGTGQTAVWIPEYGFCERISVNSPIVKHLAVLDRAVVFLGDARDNSSDPTTVSVVLLR